MKVVTPAAVIAPMAPTQSTPVVRWSTSSARQPSAVVIGRASALARSGGFGSRKVIPARTSRIPAAASAISGEWAATETGSSMARFAPSSFAMPSAASTAGRSPLTTTWPGELRFATPKMPCSPACATSSGRRSSSRPMIAAMRPSRPAPEACIFWPRIRTRRTASARSSAPAATRAEYCPIEWPAANAGSGMSTPSWYQRSLTASR